MLRFFDPDAEGYLRSHEEDAGRAGVAESRAETAEAHVVELEAELQRLRGE